MPDREKVIKGLECCKRKDGSECRVCPYTESEYCTEDMVTDALALLKEQEDVSDALVDQCDRVIRLRKELAEQPQIVRCKDCKWNNGYTGCDKYLLPHGGDWFCADGVKKDG